MDMDRATEANGTATEGSVRTPPYVSYKSFQTLLDDFKTTGVPPRIDRSVLTRFSGGLASQLLGALRTLGLMDEKHVPTPALENLAMAYGTADYPAQLRTVLERSYPFLHSVDLTTATPSMFAEAFKNATGAREDVLRKCRTFYLHAAKDAGIDIGQRLATGTFPRSVSTNVKRRRRSTARSTDNHEAPVVRTAMEQPPAQAKALEYQLIDLMSEPDIDDEVKKSIWSLVQYLTARKARAHSPE